MKRRFSWVREGSKTVSDVDRSAFSRLYAGWLDYSSVPMEVISLGSEITDDELQKIRKSIIERFERPIILPPTTIEYLPGYRIEPNIEDEP